MKTKWILSAMLAASIVATANANAYQISVYVNGKTVMFPDSGPRMMGQRVMVPLRGVFEDMGADVDWNSARREVRASLAGKDVVCYVGDKAAMVNGTQMVLDQAPMQWNNRVYVPLRFIGESLGADVRWEPTMEAVYINTTDSANIGNNNTNNNNNNNNNNTNAGTPLTIEQSTIIPLLLNNELNSKTAQKGDRFTATLDTRGNDSYAGLPRGTIVQGHVVQASAKNNDSPGMLDLDFDRIVLPGGHVATLDASVINLDSKDIRSENGVMIANKTTQKDDLKFVGYGAGAGALLALVTKGNLLTNAVIGGAIGYLFGLTQKDKSNFHDVTLKTDTKMGIQLNKDLDVIVR